MFPHKKARFSERGFPSATFAVRPILGGPPLRILSHFYPYL